MMQKSCFSFLFVLILNLVSKTLSAEAIPDLGLNCVAWKTTKVMFLVNMVYPVGTSCSVQVTRSPKGNELTEYKVIVPIASFDSGEKDRDKEVLKILKADMQSDIEIIGNITAKVPEQSITISVAGEKFTLPVKATIENNVLYVQANTQFSNLNMKAPSVLGGFIAKVKDILELHAKIEL